MKQYSHIIFDITKVTSGYIVKVNGEKHACSGVPSLTDIIYEACEKAETLQEKEDEIYARGIHVGDIVTCDSFGEGNVDKFDEDKGRYRVYFKNGSDQYYNKHGRLYTYFCGEFVTNVNEGAQLRVITPCDGWEPGMKVKNKRGKVGFVDEIVDGLVFPVSVVWKKDGQGDSYSTHTYKGTYWRNSASQSDMHLVID
jgi:hypothetical protein